MLADFVFEFIFHFLDLMLDHINYIVEDSYKNRKKFMNGFSNILCYKSLKVLSFGGFFFFFFLNFWVCVLVIFVQDTLRSQFM